ncbi:tRNA pseudouridine synthase B [Planctomycetes bacterium K23_9]|uniref:tRNA pseudouridine synthase B n=2 Tax=Stieleria marina TaxID=1930275 RepID=A0A517NWZ7_9BACT|nr:tRNA pseudouridine synthase B [Planctomycetes bacterium K23_9]
MYHLAIVSAIDPFLPMAYHFCDPLFRVTTVFGFINCNKPAGMTSRDVVNIVQRRLKPDKIKVGHCGTLDPLAEGVLLLGIGSAVRLTPYVQDQPKRYIGKFRLGASSDTGDLENGFVSHGDLPQPNRQQLHDACTGLTGLIKQIPPAYSAIWVDGQRAYDRVRRGEQVDMPSRTVSIHELSLVDYDFPMMTLDTLCGSGTYIRTLGIDVARAAQSMAVMTHLVRTEIGSFHVDKSVTIDQLRDAPLEPLLMPAALAVTHLPRIDVDDHDTYRLQNGLCLHEELGISVTDDAQVAAFTPSGQLCAILRRKPRGWCPYRGFPIDEVPRPRSDD